MTSYQPMAALGVVLFAFVLGPALLPGGHIDSTGVMHDGQDGTVQGAMSEVFAHAKKDPTPVFKTVRDAALVCANGVSEWGETPRIASAKAVADVFSRSVSYAIDDSKGERTMADVQRYLQKIMIAKVKVMSKKDSHDPMSMAIGMQNISFENTTRCVFAVARDELRKQTAS